MRINLPDGSFAVACISPCILLLLGFFCTVAAAGTKSAGPRVIRPVKQGVSKPLGEIRAPVQMLRVMGEERALPLGSIGKKGGRQAQRLAVPARDAALQQSAPLGRMPEPIMNFEGLNNIAGYYPPDPSGDVGPNHYLQITNVYFQVFDKTTGAPLTQPQTNNAVWNGFGGVCETTNHGDAIVLYDQFADRWLLSQFSVSGPYHQCIAISQTGDPTGAWFLYDYKLSDTVMNDYPKFGVWPDGYYMAVNQYAGSSWAGQGAAVFDRTAMLAGHVSPAMIYFNMRDNAKLGGMLPADADGVTPPPEGAPNYFIQADDDAAGYPADQLQIFEFSADWKNPANSTFAPSAVSPLPVAPFSFLVKATVPQPDTSSLLHNVGDRLMYRLQYRNFGDHQSMVVNHSVDTADMGNGIAGIRWYELRDNGAGWTIRHQGTYAGDAPNGEHRWMGSMAMDSQGNLGLGYSVSSKTVYPSIRYAGRLAGDPDNTLAQGENTVIDGTGSQTATVGRWGDYSMMSVDPVDDCTFWYTAEYYQTTSGSGWQTRLGSFRFPSCSGVPGGALEGTVTDASGAPLQGVSITIDDGADIHISTTSDAAGFYTVKSLPPKPYLLTVEKFGFTTATAADVVITAGSATTRNFILAKAPIHTLSGTVTDKSTGWPLYAEINYGPGTVWTDPASGRYSVLLPETEFSLAVSARSYETVFSTLDLTGGAVQDFQLQAAQECTVQGYYITRTDVLAESFDVCGLPPGWTVNNLGGSCDWTVSDPNAPFSETNYTGGTGCFADASSDRCGNGTTMDTELVTPSIDCSVLTSANLEFKYDVFDYLGRASFAADVSTDGGNNWTNVWSRTGEDDRGPRTALIDISGLAAGRAAVKIRFRYATPIWDWWWQVDDVSLHENPVCNPPANGGLVIGNVYDANTGEGLNNVLVSSDAGGAATTTATPDDPNLDDGYYSLYLPAPGPATLTAGKRKYETAAAGVTIPAMDAAALDFHLRAGRITPDPDSLEVHVPLNSALSATLSLNNTGTADADFELMEINAPAPVPPNGPFADPVRHISPKLLDELDSGDPRYDYPVPNVPVMAAAGDVYNAWYTGLAYGWGIGYQNNTSTLWIGNPSAGGGDDLDREYNLAGASTGATIDVAGVGGAQGLTDFAYDWANKTMWQMAVKGDNCIHELDPATLEVTGDRICPSLNVTQRGLAYNPLTDTFYAGGWNDSTIHEFDRNGTILRSTNLGIAVSGLAFNPATGHIFAMVNDKAFKPEVYVVDVPAEGNFTVIGLFDIPGFANNGGAGLAMGCNGQLWAVDQIRQAVLAIDSGETFDCTLDIPWLTAAPLSDTLPAGTGRRVTLEFDSTGLAPGVWEGHLLAANSTPYGYFHIPVTMVVEPDRLLSVSIDAGGSGNGTVVADSGPVNCGATCAGEYPYNKAVTLTALADTGSTFAGWLGDCAGTQTQCTVTMTRERHISAVFNSETTADSFLTVNVTGNGQGGVISEPAGIQCGPASGGNICNAGFAVNGPVSLTPTAGADSSFMGWSGDCTGTGQCLVAMDKARYVAATFTNTVTATRTMEIRLRGNGTGGIVSTPTGIFCGTTGTACSAPFDDNVPVTLSAFPAPGSSFNGWAGDCIGNSPVCTLAMDRSHAASAAFTLQTFAMTVQKTGKGDGLVISDPPGIKCGADCSQSYEYGAAIILSVRPDRNSALAGWQGTCLEPAANPPSQTCTVEIRQAENITVIFKPAFPWSLFVPAAFSGGK